MTDQDIEEMKAENRRAYQILRMIEDFHLVDLDDSIQDKVVKFLEDNQRGQG